MERFYHIRVHRSASAFGKILYNGGATVHLESVNGDPLHLRMRVAYCNPSDVFCKKEGREHCLGREARREMVTRRDPETGEAYQHPMVWPGVDPAPAGLVSLRQLPSEFGKIWRTIHKRAHVKIVQGAPQPEYDHLIRQWLP